MSDASAKTQTHTERVPPAQPDERAAEAATALASLSTNGGESQAKERKADEKADTATTEEAPAPTDATAKAAADDLGWILAGVLGLFVLLVSRAGPKGLERLDRARRLGRRIGNRLGPRLVRWMGSLFLVLLSCAGEALDFFAGEALERVGKTDEKKEEASSVGA